MTVEQKNETRVPCLIEFPRVRMRSVIGEDVIRTGVLSLSLSLSVQIQIPIDFSTILHSLHIGIHIFEIVKALGNIPEIPNFLFKKMIVRWQTSRLINICLNDVLVMISKSKSCVGFLLDLRLTMAKFAATVPTVSEVHFLSSVSHI